MGGFGHAFLLPNQPPTANLGSGMDGTEAAQEILGSHGIPVLFLSSHSITRNAAGEAELFCLDVPLDPLPIGPSSDLHE